MLSFPPPENSCDYSPETLKIGPVGVPQGGGQAQRGSLDPHSSQLPTCTSLPTESLLFHLHMVSRVPEQKDCRGGSIYLAMRKLPSMLGWGFPMGQLLRGTYLCSHMAPHLCLSVSKHNKLNGSPSYPSLNGISTLLCCWFPIWSGWTLVGIPPGKIYTTMPSPHHLLISRFKWCSSGKLTMGERGARKYRFS